MKRIPLILSLALLLLLPAIALLFTDEVQWTAGDFLFAAVLLGGTGLLVELVVRTYHESQKKPIYYVRKVLGISAPDDRQT